MSMHVFSIFISNHKSHFISNSSLLVSYSSHIMTSRPKPQNDYPHYRDRSRDYQPKRTSHFSDHSHSDHYRHSNQTSNYEEKGRRKQQGGSGNSNMHAVKNHFVAMSGEFVGTFMFLFFAFTTHLMVADQASDKAISNGANSSQTVVFISLAYGFSLLVTVWAWYRISGGLFNPAVSTPSPCMSTHIDSSR